jgi:tetratricopeptide (TPR) repeat protein
MSGAWTGILRLGLIGLLLAAVPLITAGRAQAGDPEPHIREAVAAYHDAMESDDRDLRQAEFRRAERLFAAALEAGAHNADLLTNLGNAALQAEHLGPAVLAYRRALLLEPAHERARQNLEHARRLMPEWVPTPDEGSLLDSFFLWQRSVSRADRADAAALAFLAAALCLAFWIVRGSAGARVLALLPASIWGVLIVSLVLDPAGAAEREGVVVVPEAIGRSADSINAPQRFGEPLPGGTELRILDDRGGWLHVELYNGRNAWITESSLGRVGGPIGPDAWPAGLRSAP